MIQIMTETWQSAELSCNLTEYSIEIFSAEALILAKFQILKTDLTDISSTAVYYNIIVVLPYINLCIIFQD